MNKEIKAKWIQALRSGKYKQAIGSLRKPDGFCCLGVLCDLHSKETGNPWEDDGRCYDGDRHLLSAAVLQWAGLKKQSNVNGHPQILGDGIAHFNDGTRNKPQLAFPAIADLIEQHL